jgi:hypothetical protein
MHTITEVWIDEARSDVQSLLHLLEDARNKLFAEEMALLSRFTIYEPPLGGKFPRATYDRIITEIQTIVISMALMVHTTKDLGGLSTQREERWLHHLARVIKSTDFNAHIITSLLSSLCCCIEWISITSVSFSTGAFSIRGETTEAQ